MIREMSPIEIAAMDVAHDPEVFLTAPRCTTHFGQGGAGMQPIIPFRLPQSYAHSHADDLRENSHPCQWIANGIILGLLLWGLFFWVVL